MFQKQIILLLLLLLSSCGYEAIYSKKNSVNYNFSVSELNFVGDRTVNLKIKEKLNNYVQAKKEKDFILKIIFYKEYRNWFINDFLIKLKLKKLTS